MKFTHSALIVALIVAVLVSCGGDKKEAEESTQAENYADPERTEFRSVRLDNGITLYLREDHADDKVAVEFFFPAGFTFDPTEKVQLAHVAEHVFTWAASDSFSAGEVLEELSRWGRVTAKAQANCVHFDFALPVGHLEQIISFMAAQVRSARMDDELVEAQVGRAVSEIDYILSPEGDGAMTRFAIMSLCQVILHGRTDVPIYREPFSFTAADVQDFCETYYRPDDMVIAIVGGFDSAAAEEMVRRHFGPIARRPEPEKPSVSLPRTVSATWDIGAEGFFLVFPGPYNDVRDRVALAMFGSYLRKYVSQIEEIRDMSVSVFTSSPIYPIGTMPYFVYGQAREPFTNVQLRDALEKTIEAAKAGIDERMLGAIKRNVTGFLQYTSLSPIQSYRDRLQSIGQEAQNAGFKHLFREGMSDEEMLAIVDSITLEDMNRIVNRFISDGNKHVVTFKKK